MSRRTSAEGDSFSQKRRIVLRSSSCSSVNAMLVGTSRLSCTSHYVYVQRFDLLTITPNRIYLQRVQGRAYHGRGFCHSYENLREVIQIHRFLTAFTSEHG